MFDIPIYEDVTDTDRPMALCGEPGTAIAFEELHAMGCETFIVCGGAGALTNDRKVGETIEKIVSCLKEMEVPFKTGKTWTTDAIYAGT